MHFKGKTFLCFKITTSAVAFFLFLPFSQPSNLFCLKVWHTQLFESPTSHILLLKQQLLRCYICHIHSWSTNLMNIDVANFNKSLKIFMKINIQISLYLPFQSLVNKWRMFLTTMLLFITHFIQHLILYSWSFETYFYSFVILTWTYNLQV